MVILGHIANWFMRAYPDIEMSSYVGAVLLNGVCRVSVPLFFMISGALLLEQRTDYKKNTKRTLNMLSKTVLWTAIYIVWDFLYLGDEYIFRDMFATPVRVHFWFLFVMVGIYATVPLWQKLVSGDSQELMRYFSIAFLVILAISFVLRFFRMEVTYEIPLLGSSCYACYFIMGYVIRHYIDRIRINKWISVAAIFVCMAVTDFLTLFFTFKTGVHYEAFSGFSSVFVAIPSLSVFYLFMKMKDLKPLRWMTVISANSFGIYMIHVFFLDILQENINISKVNFYIGAPIFFIILLSLSILSSWLYEKAKGKSDAI